MSSLCKNVAFNGKMQTVADLENAVIDLETNVTNLNKYFLRRLFKGFASLTNALEGAEPGIFSTVIRWYRLYLRVQISIDPNNAKFLNYFEKTIPTAITYIIGCLQHKTKEIQNYHYSLLEIIEQLLENVKPNIFNKIIKLETGTIACLWNPIDYAGDYNTQLKALKILSLFLKHLDNDKQNEELKSIKWTNLNLFQDKLKTIIQESKLATVFDNTARELLNNYNMNLSKNVLVYSFHCKSLILGTKYKFYKPLKLAKFWIDINYCPKTLSFNGRFKLDSDSKYEDINVILKIQNIKMENHELIVNYHKPGEFSKYCKEISATSENFIKLSLNHEEEQRLKENHFVVDYFNKSKIVDNDNPPPRRTSDVFQKSYNFLIGSSPNETAPEQNKNNKNVPTKSDTHETNKKTKSVSSELAESPKTSRIRPDTLEKQPIRKMPSRKRKFFLSLLDEEHFETEEETKKPLQKAKRKSKAKRKPRQPTKKATKQVCKVSPIVDLTDIDEVTTKDNVLKSSSPIVHITNDLNGGDEKCIPSLDTLTTQQCSTILKNVSDIYHVGDTTYAEPCQSYRNFKTQRAPGPVTTSIDKKPVITRVRKVKPETINVENDTVDKENIDPNILKTVTNLKGKHAVSNTKSMISPNVFGTQTSDEVAPAKKLRPSNDNTVIIAEIDLTADDPIIIDPQEQPINPKPSDNDICTIHQLTKSTSYENILNDDLLDYEVVRLAENPIAHATAMSTPNITKLYCSNTATPTSTMNISEINDSDMELTQPTNKSNYIMDKFEIKEKEEPSPKKAKQLGVVDQILNDWSVDDVATIQKTDDIEQGPTDSNILEVVTNNDENDLQHSVVLQKRCDDSDSTDSCDETHPSINFLKQPDFMINEDFVIMQNMPLNINPSYYNIENIWNTPDKNNVIVKNVSTKTSTECQVTPNALILRQIQVSTKESVLVAGLKQKHQSPLYCKAKKSLNGFYNHRPLSGQQHQPLIKATLKQTNPANENGPVDNNNNVICSYEVPPKRTYLALKRKDKQIEVSNTLQPLSHNNLNVTNVIPINGTNMVNETAIVPYNKTFKACMAMETADNPSGTEKNVIHLQNNNSMEQNECHYNRLHKTVTLESKDKQQNVDSCENTLKPSSITKTISLLENDITNENINIENSFLYQNPISYDELETFDATANCSNEIETIAVKRSSQYNNYLAENMENLNNNSIDNVISLFSDENSFININTGTASSESQNNQEFFENELSQLVDDYNARMQIRIEDARRLCLTNTSDLFAQKVREITESVLRKSEEQKKELELVRTNIERLVTRMEWQFQIFIKKSKLYDNYKEITERSLQALAELNVQHRIQSEYQELRNQLKIDQNEVLQEVWQNFIEKKKKDYLNNIDNLSKI